MHLCFPGFVFDESVLKCIDVASAEIKIVWSVHRFPFQMRIRYVFWRDLARLCGQMQIWIFNTSDRVPHWTLRGIKKKNVWTVINWLVAHVSIFLLIAQRWDHLNCVLRTSMVKSKSAQNVFMCAVNKDLHPDKTTNKAICTYPGWDSPWAYRL